MATVDDVLSAIAELHSLLSYIATKGIRGGDVNTTGGISDISTYLGLITSGEFRSGNGSLPGRGFSGVRLGYPGFTYDGSSWVLAGVSNDVLQVGISLANGKLLAGAGAVTLDASGITATAGAIGAWVLDASGLQSANYSANVVGARIDGTTGDAEFNNIKARGSLISAVIEYNQIMATAGSNITAKAAGKLKNKCYVNDAPTSTEIDLEDPISGHLAVFEVGDIVRLKEGARNCWLVITAVSDQTTFYAYYATLSNGTAADFEAGAAVTDYGQDGDGWVLITADDATTAPSISIVTHSGSPWSDAVERVRIGNLNGMLDNTSNKYGIAIGDSNGYFQYEPVGGLAMGFADDTITVSMSGLIINGTNFGVTYQADIDGSGDKQLQSGIFYQPGRDDTLVSGWKHSGLFRKYEASGSVSTAEMLTTYNPGFEDGDESHFTITHSGTFDDPPVASATHAVSTLASYIYAGSYGEAIQLTTPEDATGYNSWLRIQSTAVAVTPGNYYTFSVAVKQISLNRTWPGYTASYTSIARFYDASGVFLSYQNISTTAPTGTYRVDSGAVMAPTGAATALIEVYLKVAKGASVGTITWKIALDSFSIVGETVSGAGGSWNNVQRETYLFMHKDIEWFSENGNLYKLVGVRQDVIKPSALTATASAAAGNVDVGTHSYKVTFVDEFGETDGGTASAQVTVATNAKQVDLTAIPLGGWGTKTRKIYRTVAGDTGSYMYVGEVMDNTTTTYTDDVADANLGDIIPSLNTTGSRPVLPTRTMVLWTYPKGSAAMAGWTFNANQILASYNTASSVSNGDDSYVDVYLNWGIYTVELWYVKSSASGKLDLYLDDTCIHSGLDLYAASSTYNGKLEVTNVSVPRSGSYRFRLLVNGKNGSSTGYQFRITCVGFARTDY